MRKIRGLIHKGFRITLIVLILIIGFSIIFPTYNKTIVETPEQQPVFSQSMNVHSITQQESNVQIILTQEVISWDPDLEEEKLVREVADQYIEETYLKPKVLYGFYESERVLIELSLANVAGYYPDAGDPVTFEIYTPECVSIVFWKQSIEDHSTNEVRILTENSTCTASAQTEISKLSPVRYALEFINEHLLEGK